MNKGDLTSCLAAETGLSRAQSEHALNALLDCITTALSKGDAVSLIGFGSFAVSDRPARTGRNPQTGAAISIPAGRKVSFKAGKGLKEAMSV